MEGERGGGERRKVEREDEVGAKRRETGGREEEEGESSGQHWLQVILNLQRSNCLHRPGENRSCSTAS